MKKLTLLVILFLASLLSYLRASLVLPILLHLIWPVTNYLLYLTRLCN